MAWQPRLADSSFVGAIGGLVASAVVFVVLMLASNRLDEDTTGKWSLCVACVMRMIALLSITLGLGLGYMIGRAFG